MAMHEPDLEVGVTLEEAALLTAVANAEHLDQEVKAWGWKHPVTGVANPAAAAVYPAFAAAAVYPANAAAAVPANAAAAVAPANAAAVYLANAAAIYLANAAAIVMPRFSKKRLNIAL